MGLASYPRRCRFVTMVMTLANILVVTIILPSGMAQAAEPWRHVIMLPEEAQRHEHVAFFTLAQGALFQQIRAMARVDADASRVIDIHAAGSGKVVAVHVTPGQPVRQGDALVSYTDHTLHELQLQREQAEASLASARASEAESARLYRRGLALVGRAVSRGELERRQMLLAQQHSLVKAREADLATLEHRRTEEFTSVTERIVQAENSDLISPINGVVQAVRTAVAADINMGDHVVTVVDLSKLWLIANLSPEDAAGLVVGGKAQFRPAGQEKGRVIDAHISTLAGLADPSTGLVRMVCVLDHPPSWLRPGMMLDGTFQTGEATHGLLVPDEALQQIDGEDIVFLRQDATHFMPVSVRIIARNDDQAVVSQTGVNKTEVSPPLREGVQIVGEGSFALKSMALISSMSAD